MGWNVRFSGPALRDFSGIIEWTTREFGPAQAIRYEALIAAAADKLLRGPMVVPAKEWPALEGVRCLPVLEGRRRARHLLFFSWSGQGGQGSIQILRILHASMDPALHLPPEA